MLPFSLMHGFSNLGDLNGAGLILYPNLVILAFFEVFAPDRFYAVGIFIFSWSNKCAATAPIVFVEVTCL